MSNALDPEEARLDALWRHRFGQPLPIRGSADLALEILGENVVFASPPTDEAVAPGLPSGV